MSQASDDLDIEIKHQHEQQDSYKQNLRYTENQIAQAGGDGSAPIHLLRQRDAYNNELTKIRQRIQELEQQKQAYASTKLPGGPQPSADPSLEDTLPMQNSNSIKIYTIYADADKIHKQRLETQLAAYTWNGMITLWDKGLINAGPELTQQEINTYIDTAQIILLLISPNFSADKNCVTDMRRAMQRRIDKKTTVIPIYIRPTDWPGAPFEGLLSLPRNKPPVSSWSKADEAWYDVAIDIRRACEGARRP